MKMLNAWTLELDEPELAVKEILEQLDLEKNAMKNSAGFITCSYDFIESDIVSAICDALPFDVVGCTTLTNGNNDESGGMLLCLTVLTADDCEFATVLTDSLLEDVDGAIDAAVSKAKSDLDSEAKLAMAFFPMCGIGGEIILTSLDQSMDGVPIFCIIACSEDTAYFEHSFVISNGKHYKDCASLLLISGNVDPRFVVMTTSEQNLRKQQALITSSDGAVLKQINNMTVREYFETIGLVIDGGIEGLVSLPFMVDYNDGTPPVARAIYSLSEDGSAICGGGMPEGSTLYFGRMDFEDIVSTAKDSSKTLVSGKDINGIIMFPCLGRFMVLALDPLVEIEKVRETIDGQVPWHFAYSGGESCPLLSKDGRLINRFHNFTFVGCAI